MKKQIIVFTWILLITTVTLSAQERETRNVETFTKISFRVPGKLYLRQGNTQKVELQGDKDLLEEIETEVQGNRLVIGKEGKWSDWKWNADDKITVYITMKDIEGLGVGGSGDLIAETKLITGDLDLNVSGSGSLKAQIESSGEVEADVSGSGDLIAEGKCQSFSSSVSGSGKVIASMAIRNNAHFAISGSGKIEAKGSASNVKTNISGSGKVLAADLQTNKCHVRISGSGDVEISVKEELDANISGSGTVSYRGNPQRLNSHSSGSGKVSKM